MARVRIEFPEKTLFTHELPVRIDDLNYGRHLGHDTLVAVLHEARAQLFRHLGMEEYDAEGVALMVADLAVAYRSEAFFGQVLRIEIAAGEVRSRSCELLYRVSDRADGRLVALAQTWVVFVDPASRRPAPIPARFREFLASGDADAHSLSKTS